MNEISKENLLKESGLYYLLLTKLPKACLGEYTIKSKDTNIYVNIFAILSFLRKKGYAFITFSSRNSWDLLNDAVPKTNDKTNEILYITSNSAGGRLDPSQYIYIGDYFNPILYKIIKTQTHADALLRAEKLLSEVGSDITDYTHTINKVKNLRFDSYGDIASGEKKNDTIISSIKAFLGAKKSDSVSVIDSEDDLKYISPDFTGIIALSNKFEMMISAIFEIPYTILFGQTMGGLNTSNAGDIEAWNKQILAYQTNIISPMLELMRDLEPALTFDLKSEINLDNIDKRVDILVKLSKVDFLKDAEKLEIIEKLRLKDE